MGRLSTREKILLLILGFLIVFYVYYNYIIVSQMKKYEAGLETLNSDKFKLNTLMISKKNIDKLKKEIDNINGEVNKSLLTIPDSERLPEIIANIYDATSGSGCTPGEISFGSPALKGSDQVKSQDSQESNSQQKENGVGIMVVPINYRITGNYDNIISFLKMIEGNTRRMIIDKISIAKVGSEGQLSVDLSISSFYLQNNDSKGTVNYDFQDNSYGKPNMFN